MNLDEEAKKFFVEIKKKAEYDKEFWNKAQEDESIYISQEAEDSIMERMFLVYYVEKVEHYEKALKFYADKERYKEWDKDSDLTYYIHDVDFDGGDIARKALEGE